MRNWITIWIFYLLGVAKYDIERWTSSTAPKRKRHELLMRIRACIHSILRYMKEIKRNQITEYLEVITAKIVGASQIFSTLQTAFYATVCYRSCWEKHYCSLINVTVHITMSKTGRINRVCFFLLQLHSNWSIIYNFSAWCSHWMLLSPVFTEGLRSWYRTWILSLHKVKQIQLFPSCALFKPWMAREKEIACKLTSAFKIFLLSAYQLLFAAWRSINATSASISKRPFKESSKIYCQESCSVLRIKTGLKKTHKPQRISE